MRFFINVCAVALIGGTALYTVAQKQHVQRMADPGPAYYAHFAQVKARADAAVAADNKARRLERQGLELARQSRSTE